MSELSMFVTRTAWSRPNKGSMAGIPTSLQTKDGIPVCYGADEIASGTEKDVEPLPERMIAVHGWTNELWIGVGDGKAIPLPQSFPLTRHGSRIRIKMQIMAYVGAPPRQHFLSREVGWPCVPVEGEHVELTLDRSGWSEPVKHRSFDADGTPRLDFSKMTDDNYGGDMLADLRASGWS